MSVKNPENSRRQLALWLPCAASLMIILDGTIVAFAVGAGLAGTAIVVAAATLCVSRRRPALAECC